MAKILAVPSMADRLRARFGIETISAPVTDDGDVFIRWGNSSGDFRRVVNPARAIRLNCRKYDALVAISQVTRTPRIYRGFIPRGIRAVVRPLTHSQGEGFQVIDGPRDISDSQYATAYVETDVEHRVFFAWDCLFFARRRGTDDQRAAQFPCRSNWGYEFSTEGPEALKEAVRKARQAIGLEVGAADTLTKDGEHYILELNSGPSVDHDRITAFYKDGLRRGIQRKHGVDITNSPLPGHAATMSLEERVSELTREVRELREIIDGWPRR